ncbi:MATE family efflux transporter [Parvibacter caecicola]|uniref:Multidrug export protein MepA n=1 Tax=Parvibacter caecicola TaxID=747645 RepID=A0A7W5GQ43_9ACTN|nr:MATE family efflux transporter [Parvibacter caecicola]MBB3171827.1 putative MATE family efflux protein [Parvibacter caecicola]MCR2040614.1 MATE family efflux transporter [Parvibacter caecicola]RNL10796.1 MATE family efflux transporter [Parvibacter caecicola]
MAQDMNRHFTLSALLKFTFPTICMMIFTSLYTVVDGFFVSNYIGKTALAAVNLAWPIIMILATVGLMTGTGGSALIAKTRGEGDDEQANRYFSMLVFFTIAVSLVLGALGQAAIVPAMQAFGADGPLLDSAVSYGRWLLGMLPFFALQFAFEVLFSTAGKPHYGFFVVVAGGVTNVVLDWLFICVLGWGIDGTAIATGLGQVVGGAIPLVYFARRHNSSFLRLRWTRPEWRPIGKACLNGCSELVSNIAMSLVTMLYNFQLMAYIGEDGVAAYSVIGYTAMIFGAVFMGYAVGSSPLMSYQFGAGNHGEMRSILLKSLGLIGASSLAMFLAAQWLAAPLSAIFVSYDPELLDFTVHAYKLYALAFLIMGLPIYLSALFTALNNGVVSAVIAFMRTLVFECGAVILLPLVWGINGIWLSVSVGELAAALLAVGFLVALRKRYGFAKK